MAFTAKNVQHAFHLEKSEKMAFLGVF